VPKSTNQGALPPWSAYGATSDIRSWRIVHTFKWHIKTT